MIIGDSEFYFTQSRNLHKAGAAGGGLDVSPFYPRQNVAFAEGEKEVAKENLPQGLLYKVFQYPPKAVPLIKQLRELKNTVAAPA